MRILVISDSHGNRWNFADAVAAEPSAEIVYFLGDGYREYTDISANFVGTKTFIGVRGNCDLSCDLPANDIRNIENARVYATHGYAEHVKYGLFGLEEKSHEEKCNLMLFGHTHQAHTSYRDGVHYFNPGSISNGDYGVADITESGIICINKRLVY